MRKQFLLPSYLKKFLKDSKDVIFRNHVNDNDTIVNQALFYDRLIDAEKAITLSNVQEFVKNKLMYCPDGEYTVSGVSDTNGVNEFTDQFDVNVYAVNKYNEVIAIANARITNSPSNVVITKSTNSQIENVDRFLVIMNDGSKLIALILEKNLLTLNANGTYTITQAVVNAKKKYTYTGTVSSITLPEINYSMPFNVAIKFGSDYYLINLKVTAFVDGVPLVI